jgi:hypothetical protein
MAQELQIIVIAYATETKLEPTGNYVMRDRNYFPEFESRWEGKAAVWLNRGTDEDVRKATAYARREGYSVFTFPLSEPDPLRRARERVLEQFAAPAVTGGEG